METPLSTRRITRSLAAAAAATAASSAQKSAADSAAAHFTRPKNAGAGDRAVLHDITNDSPIVGLAAGGLQDKTPASNATKPRRRPRRTPGSGEALLRGQVKALLHKVHEEQGSAAAALARPPAHTHALLGITRSPAQLLAPTPANTPQLGFGTASREGLLLPDGCTVMPCVLEEEESLIPKLQVIAAASLPPSSIEESLSEGQLHRALVFDDSPGKSDSSNSSSLKSHDSSSSGSHMDKSSSATEDDNSSAWSIQVHASSEKGDDEDELGVGEELGVYTEEDEDWEESSDDECFDDLCEEMSKMTVFDEEEKKAGGLPQFEGKHTRFIYNSDDEIQGEEVVPSAEARAELGALLLRGLPVPEGRHLRFHDDDEDED